MSRYAPLLIACLSLSCSGELQPEFDGVHVVFSVVGESPERVSQIVLDLRQVVDGRAKRFEGATSAEHRIAVQIPEDTDLRDVGYVVRLVAGTTISGQVIARADGLNAAGEPIVRWVGVLDLALRAEHLVSLTPIDEDCDRDADGSYDCARDGCCEPSQRPLGDCDDDDPKSTPLSELPDCIACVDVPVDLDCDGTPDACVDADNDGVADCDPSDCDPGRTDVVTGAAERCDGLDNDCDGETDEGFETVGTPCTPTGVPCVEDGTWGCAEDGATVVCVAAPLADDICVIGGACYQAGDAKPGDTCQLCQPDERADGWSARTDGTGCDDLSSCTPTDICTGGVCNPDGHQCSDVLDCTIDECDDSGGCDNTALKPATCLIEGVCYASGDSRPDVPCQLCDPTSETHDWSPAAEGADCGGGDACTQPGACDDQGACLVGATIPCDDKNPCTKDGCDPAAGCDFSVLLDGGPCADDGLKCTADLCSGGVCGHNAVDGACVIEDTCQSAGPSPVDACLVCDSSVSADSWSPGPDGVDCATDGLECTGDVCSKGVCTHPKLAGSCLIGGGCYSPGPAPSDPCLVCDPEKSADTWLPADDGIACATDQLDCTDDVCSNGACSHPIADGSCLIAGGCYAPGPSPTDSCVVCDPETNDSAWVAAEDGIACSADELVCTADVCSAGVCSHPVFAETCLIKGVCYPPGPSPAGDCLVCDPGGSVDTWGPAPDGAACSADLLACTEDVCAQGGCSHPLAAGFCLIDGVCYPPGPAASDKCLTCDPTTSASAWVASVDGTACGTDQQFCTDDVCVAGECTHTLKAGFCFISNKCHQPGATNPGHPCQSCQPDKDTMAFQDVPQSSKCDTDGDPCTNQFCFGGQCSDPVPVEEGAKCGSCGECYSGYCNPGSPPGSDEECYPYACNGTDTECTSYCSTSSDCQDGLDCFNGNCAVALGPGEPCDGTGECYSGICENGVCCDTYCTGDCEACGSDGYCAPVQAGEQTDGCSGDQQCGDMGYCVYGLGTGCPDSSYCASQYCADDYCCDSECIDPCYSCSLPGTVGECLPVPIGVQDDCEVGQLCDGNGSCFTP